MFDGLNDQDLFPSFLSQFENAIGRKPNLTQSTKMVYLMSSLRGYAFSTVKHSSITDSPWTSKERIFEHSQNCV